jgi:predicted 3-demethylubiquinone-9 3-methyltransferase (glyoxalase superfamily)
MQKITPFLWFEGRRGDEFLPLHFQELARAHDNPLRGERPRTEGVRHDRAFGLDGQEFIALNGGPEFTFTPAISFVVNCDTQAELDELWEKLSAGGKEVQCGWLQDKYGVSRQIVPWILGELLSDPDEARAQRVMQAMLQMVKIDIEGLRRAYGQ